MHACDVSWIPVYKLVNEMRWWRPCSTWQASVLGGLRSCADQRGVLGLVGLGGWVGLVSVSQRWLRYVWTLPLHVPSVIPFEGNGRWIPRGRFLARPR